MNCPKCNVPLNSDNICPNCGTKYEIKQVPITYVNELQQQLGQVQSHLPTNPPVTEQKEEIPKKNSNLILIIAIISFVVLVFGFLIIYQAFGDGEIKRSNNGKRTIMIYASPTNLESIAKQFTIDINNLNLDNINFDAIDVLIYTGGTEKWHNSLIKNNENAIYKLTKNGLEKQETYDRLNMSSGLTLLNFINYVYNHYESEYYDLMFYDHGGALSGTIIDYFNPNDILTLNEIETVLKKSSFADGVKIDMIMFRTCLMGTLEVANIFEPYANYLVASEDSIYMGGNDDAGCLGYLESIDLDTDTIILAKKFIDDYVSYSKYVPKDFELSYSLINLKNISKLTEEYYNVLKGIDFNSYYKLIAANRAKMHDYSSTGMIDLYTWVNTIKEISSKNISDFFELYNETVLYVVNENDYNHGISVFFPRDFNSTTEHYISVIKDVNNFNGIYNFISTYSTVIKNGKSKALTKDNIANNGSINNNREFTLELTNEQAIDFASANYIILKKVDNNYYIPIYTSDDAYLNGNILSTNITDKIIRVKGVTDNGKSINDSYISVFKDDNSNNYVTYGVVRNWNLDNDLEEWTTESATLHIVDNNGKPVIYNISLNKDNEDGSNTNLVLDEDIYNYVDFISNSYALIDKDGYYTDDYNSKNPKVYGYSTKISDLELEYASLDLSGDYYCIFAVKDIYGNNTYLKAIRLQ